MRSTIIDLGSWPRAALFDHFIDQVRCVMSLTADLDLTLLLPVLRRARVKFYPAMLWIVSTVINRREEFRCSLDAEGRLVLWDAVWPYYAHFHPEDESFVKLVTPYSEDFTAFYARFQADADRYASHRGFALSPPPNVFDVSCLPWVRYRSFDMHVFDEGTYLPPVVTWGRYQEENGRTVMPLSMNIHHAVADGFHLSRFFLEVQTLCDTFGAQLS